MFRFWWLIIIPLNLFCQSQTVNVEAFTRQDGLSSNYVTDMVMNNAGFLWGGYHRRNKPLRRQ